jgi:hypothetical protein
MELKALREQVAETRNKRKEEGDDDRDLAELVKLRIEALFLAKGELGFIIRRNKKFSSS